MHTELSQQLSENGYSVELLTQALSASVQSDGKILSQMNGDDTHDHGCEACSGGCRGGNNTGEA